jgi:AcrR family transcriptional regulator
VDFRRGYPTKTPFRSLVVQRNTRGAKPIVLRLMAPKEHVTKTLRLAAGRYTLYCSVPGRRRHDMVARLVYKRVPVSWRTMPQRRACYLLVMSSRPTQRGASTAKRLLDDAIAFLVENGPGVSLRQIAEGIGTSHAKLIYHFGDKERLFAAVMHETRKREFELFEAEAARTDGDLRALVWWSWKRSIALDDRPFTLLMLELWNSALRDPERYGLLVEGLFDPWVEVYARLLEQAGAPPAPAHVRARVLLTAMLGLELELVGPGNVAAADEALHELLDLLLP